MSDMLLSLHGVKTATQCRILFLLLSSPFQMVSFLDIFQFLGWQSHECPSISLAKHVSALIYSDAFFHSLQNILFFQIMSCLDFFSIINILCCLKKKLSFCVLTSLLSKILKQDLPFFKFSFLQDMSYKSPSNSVFGSNIVESYWS